LWLFVELVDHVLLKVSGSNRFQTASRCTVWTVCFRWRWQMCLVWCPCWQGTARAWPSQPRHEWDMVVYIPAEFWPPVCIVYTRIAGVKVRTLQWLVRSCSWIHPAWYSQLTCFGSVETTLQCLRSRGEARAVSCHLRTDMATSCKIHQGLSFLDLLDGRWSAYENSTAFPCHMQTQYINIEIIPRFLVNSTDFQTNPPFVSICWAINSSVSCRSDHVTGMLPWLPFPMLPRFSR